MGELATVGLEASKLYAYRRTPTAQWARVKDGYADDLGSGRRSTERRVAKCGGNEPFPKIVITTCRECLAGFDYAVETRQPGPKSWTICAVGADNGWPSFC